MINSETLLRIAKEHSITKGELEVLEAIIIAGVTISDVSTRLNLQPEAVRKRLGEVYQKFGILGKGPGKLAKLQQLLMNHPLPKSLEVAQNRSIAGSRRRNTKKNVSDRRISSDLDYLRFQSVADLARGEVTNRDFLISDIEGIRDIEGITELERIRNLEVISKEEIIALEEYTGCVSDWDSAPDVEPSYGREQELAQLRPWVVADRSRLIFLYGMAGIGKTTLAVKMAQELKQEFDVLIWRSLKHIPNLPDLIAGLEDFISPSYIPHVKTNTKISIDESITKLISHLKERRCLLILDDLESILEPEKIAGQYQSDHSQYGELIRRIALENHQSCLVIVSSEKIAELVTLENNKVHSLQVEGSIEIAKEILASQDLEANNSWDAVIENYGSHPLGLKVIIPIIKDLYAGQVEDFLRGNNATAYFDFHYLMDQQFNRLSPLEKQLMYTLTVFQRPVSLTELWTDSWFHLPQSELIEVMSSLRRRSLLQRQESAFSLQPMVWQHTVEQFIKEISNEIINFIEEADIDYLQTLKTYPWQINLETNPEINNCLLLLIQRYFQSKPLGKEVETIINILEENHASESGYAIANLKSLV